MTIEIRREGEINYAKPLARALLRDSRLSFGARGLFAYLWDLPAGWKTNIAHLATTGPQGRDAIRSLIAELERVGAMRDEAIRGKGGRVNGRQWILVSPTIWATESALSSSDALRSGASTEKRKIRKSVKPKIGESAPKVLPPNGSAIRTTTTVVGCGGNELIYPRLSALERTALEGLLVAVPAELQQPLLDEVAGAIQHQKIRNGVVPFARALVRAAAEGRFAPSLGVTIAAVRQAAATAANRPPVPFVADPAAQATGERLLRGIREKACA